MRIELPIYIALASNGELTDEMNYCRRQFGVSKENIQLDDKLLFWDQHFNGQDWAVYDNGAQKGGTIRFSEGKIRLPTSERLPVYLTKDFNEERGPRAYVDISDVVIAHAKDMEYEDYWIDGMTSIEHLVKDMQEYYETLTEDSILSFYRFEKTHWL